MQADTARRHAPLLIWLLFISICAWIVISQTRVRTDLSTFMPRPANPQQHFLIQQLREGPATRLILVGIEGDTQSNLARVSKQLGDVLRANDLFVRVNNGESKLQLGGVGELFAYRYLLMPDTSRRTSGEGLRSALQQRLQELSSPLAGLVTRNLQSDPTGEFERLAASWQGDLAARHLDGVWFAESSLRALLLAHTVAPGFDVDAQARTVESIESSFELAAAGTQARLLMSGPAVFAVASRDSMRSEARSLSIIASVFLAVLLLVIYRSPRVVVIGALPLATGMLVGTAAITLGFGTLHGITLGFGITLLGVAIDYPLHVFSHLKSGEAVQATLDRIWPTLRLGVLTTVFGYLGMGLTSFEGIAQLGVFAASGLLAAAAFCRWVMPGLTPPRELFDAARVRWMNPLLAPSRSAQWSLLSLAAVAGLFLFSTGRALWETDVAALSPISSELRQLDRELRAGLGAPDARHAVMVHAPDAETALQRSESLAPVLEALIGDGVISGFDSVTRYLPSAATQRARQARLPERETATQNLAQASAGLGFKSGAFEPFLQALAASRELAPLTPADLGDSPLGLRVASLLSRQDHGWVSLVTLRGVRDADRLAKRLEPHGGADVFHVDMKSVSNDMVNAYRDEALSRLTWAAALILLGLAVLLRSRRRVFAVCLSLLVALLLDLALLVLLGQRLSLFHLIALILVAGIGIDYSLFFSRPGDDTDERKRTLHALTVCAISTTTVFGTIATSKIPVLATIGATVAIGVLANFIAAMVLAQPNRQTSDELR